MSDSQETGKARIRESTNPWIFKVANPKPKQSPIIKVELRKNRNIHQISRSKSQKPKHSTIVKVEIPNTSNIKQLSKSKSQKLNHSTIVKVEIPKNQNSQNISRPKFPKLKHSTHCQHQHCQTWKRSITFKVELTNN